MATVRNFHKGAGARRPFRSEPMPQAIVPMLARLTNVPPPQGPYASEIKWDGIRAIAYLDHGKLMLQSRNLLELTYQYPELHGLADEPQLQFAVLDGEIVAFNAEGRPSFEALQNRMGVTSAAVARQRAPAIPVVYMIFDLLYLDGASLMHRPYIERRERLEALELNSPRWQTPPYSLERPADVLSASRAQQLEGIVVKRLDSIYEPGLRSGAWLKIKNVQRQECVIAGWLPGEGSRAGTIGSLLMGVYEPDPDRLGQKRLVYAGKAGTGFTDKMLAELLALLSPLRIATKPFAPNPYIPKGAVFVEPRYVGEFEFTEWTKQNILRHPSFKGLRLDKRPEDVVREYSGR
ncbi:MAG TPA: non-homologous end-joining DNA ligase [Planctomycetota bacterium]|nr:non-homologous end-joining DNA ligase [Planctomycetota bacterium]